MIFYDFNYTVHADLFKLFSSSITLLVWMTKKNIYIIKMSAFAIISEFEEPALTAMIAIWWWLFIQLELGYKKEEN